VARRQLSPILVVLRDYGAEKKARNCSILQFIESTSNSNYQTQSPGGAFEYLLLNGHVLVVFDGLDELLDTRYRQEISSDVEAFCNLYPSVPVLVTSREVGYEQAPLDETKFEIFQLSPFTEEQVRNYAYKWFGADPEFGLEQRKQKTEAFLQESRIAPDLRSNPLMLALMCNIYRGENYIPRNRPDVYEKCALMLFERWDRMRGINASLPFEAHIRPTMMYLAHWIYSEDTLQGGVTEQRLIAYSAEIGQ
jgi:predicted NACHT family NTPase